ncbi:signal peptidase II [Metamycoplasma phocicerebrale]|uniref:Lipoprotein signal peptidase n=1 Tax=Metamycoplasma phocicerebrale TaxID=142649 RepID=A0A3Q9V8C0_9BACT|nr:signal peptidase II [Metamycoplasma phocicerebrale]AZZ65397.1 signal peptidase II [Metamycoplasma phocicerebrale]
MEDKKLKYFSKEYWKKYWKIIVINISIFIGAMFLFALVDLLTKEFLFKWKDKANLIVNEDYAIGNSFIIFKSILHKGTTIGIFESNMTMLHIISFLIIFGALFGITFIKDKNFISVSVFLSMVAGGSFGNMYDRFAFGGVRDIINLPWANYGVFNFADVWLVVGAIGTLLSIIITISVVYAKNKKKQENDQNFENDSVSFNSQN